MIELALILYVVILFAISMASSGNKRGTESKDFFTAGHTSRWYMVAFGMIGATMSGITVVSVPGMVGVQSMTYMQMVFGFFIGYVVVAYVLLPLYYSMGFTSIYQYLRVRYGKMAHLTGAAIFLVYKLLSAAVKLYVVLLVLHRCLLSSHGISFVMTAVMVVGVIYLYTFRSGVRTVVWTDCFQTLMLIIAAVVLTINVYSYISMPASDVWQWAVESPYSNIFVFDDLSSRQHFVKQFLSGVFIVVVMTGLDQDVMQKNLTCRTLPEARKNMLLCGISFTPINFLFLVLGLLFLLAADRYGIALPEKSDEIVPMFAEMFGGVSVLCLCLGLMSASFSSADSALVGLTTSFFIDILGKRADDVKPRQRYVVHLAFAVLVTIIICIVGQTSATNALNAIYTIVSYLYAPLLGLFAYGIMSRRHAKDEAVPVIALSVPIVMYGAEHLCDTLWQYHFGYELLLLGAAHAMLWLYVSSLFASHSDEK